MDRLNTSTDHPAAATVSHRPRVDWRVLLMLPPARRFTPAELHRAATQPPSGSLRVAAGVNLALPTVAVLVGFGRDMPFGVVLALLTMVGMVGLGLSWAWRDPSSTRVRWLYCGLPLACGLALGLHPLVDADAASNMALPSQRTAVMAAAMMAGAAALALWFGIVYRHQHIALRLAELDERDRAVAMARQLAAAQIRPHFLFNSLASLQHWVATQDARAAPLLTSLTAFLRATLPLFDRPSLRVGEELHAVRHYLEVMQARLGDRLRFRIDVPEPVLSAQLPPGVLLTLVENAVEHGVQASLSGAEIRIDGRLDSAADGSTQACIDIHDSGPGIAPGAVDGVGLTNTRARLAQVFGAAAALDMRSPPGGGCTAALRLPISLPNSKPAPP